MHMIFLFRAAAAKHKHTDSERLQLDSTSRSIRRCHYLQLVEELHVVQSICLNFSCPRLSYWRWLPSLSTVVRTLQFLEWIVGMERTPFVLALDDFARFLWRRHGDNIYYMQVGVIILVALYL